MTTVRRRTTASKTSSTAATAGGAVVYPDRDGKPLAENGVNAIVMADFFIHLREVFAGADVYVGMNSFVYYEEGNPKANVAPDLFVVLGVPMEPPRPVYFVWVEGAMLSLTIEVTSRSTRREDFGRKRELYARLGVREYFLYDPRHEYLDPPFQGNRLVDGEYQPIPPDESARLMSEVLGYRIGVVADRLRLFDRTTGALIPMRAERAAMAEQRAAAEEAARREAEQRAAAEEAARRAAEERAAAEEAARREAEERAAAEEVARRAAEEEAAAMRARLAALEAMLRRPEEP